MAFMAKLKDMFVESIQEPSAKMADQTVERIYKLISELDSTKYSQKLRLEEKNIRIMELQLLIREKEQESMTAQKYLEIKKEELKAKEKYILKVENNCIEIKAKCQQDLERAENEKNSLENHYLHEISLLKAERGEAKVRPAQRTAREKDSPSRNTYGRYTSQERNEALKNEMELLKSERDDLATQLYIEQQKALAFKHEREQIKKSFDENQNLLKVLRSKISTLSDDLEANLELNNTIQQQLDEQRQRNEEIMVQLEEKSNQLDATSQKLVKTNDQLEEYIGQYEFVIKQVKEWETKKSSSGGLKTNRNGLKLDLTPSKESLQKMRMSVPSSRETSPKISSKTLSIGTSLRHSSNIFSKEKELQTRIIELEKAQKDVKTKSDLLQNENTAIIKKLSLRDKECGNLKQEIQGLKDRLKKVPSSAGNLDLLRNEVKKLKKTSQTYELELSQAKQEIKRLMISKEESEHKTQKESKKGVVSKEPWSGSSLISMGIVNDKQGNSYSRSQTLTSDRKESHLQISIEYTDRSQYSDQITPEVKLKEVGEDELVIGEFQMKHLESSRNGTEKSITSYGVADDEEMDRLRKENYDLNVQLTSKDLKLQNLMKLSANTLKVLTEEFLRLASNILADLNDKVKDESAKWLSFEVQVEQLVTKYVHLTNENKRLDAIIKNSEGKNIGIEKPEKTNSNKKQTKSQTQSVWRLEENRSLKRTIEKILEAKPVKAENELTRIKTTRSRSDVIDVNNLFKNLEPSCSQLTSPNIKSSKSNSSKKEVTYSSEKKIKNTWPAHTSGGKPNEEHMGTQSLSRFSSPKNANQPDILLSSARRYKKDDVGEDLEIEDFDLGHFLTEMKGLKTMVLQKESAVNSLRETHSSPKQQAQQKQKISELFENVLLSEKVSRGHLERIKEATLETDTVQDDYLSDNNFKNARYKV